MPSRNYKVGMRKGGSFSFGEHIDDGEMPILYYDLRQGFKKVLSGVPVRKLCFCDRCLFCV